MRDIICLVLATLLSGCTTLEAKVGAAGAIPPGQAEPKAKPTLKEQVIQMQAGSQVEVRLLSKERFRGRLGEVSDEGFTLQIAQANRIETRKVAFGDVKYVKAMGNNEKKRGILIGVGATLGTLLVLALTIGHLGRED
ncbi:MAG: hypothetical protein ABSA70_06950 [Terriglobia bacterium]